jgi:hypothetical protein
MLPYVGTDTIDAVDFDTLQYSNLYIYQHLYMNICYSNLRSRDRSVSIVSDYGLDDRAIGDRSLVNDLDVILNEVLSSWYHSFN